ncbi:MAG: CHRD domain-containing protein [Chloroflexales bacterium]|nr:CHRD domain-containing protein [Chloroflexales bacterium]
MDRGARDSTVSLQQDNLPRHWLGEAAGYVTLVPTATTQFRASLSGANEVPANNSSAAATAVMTYTAATRTLDYNITFTKPFTISNPGAHIHRGVAGVNGDIAVDLIAQGPVGPGTSLTGSVAIPEADVAALFSTKLYLNFHTVAFPDGEIRGQIQPAEAFLRVPVHAAPRLAASMDASQTSFDFDTALTETSAISLTGQGLSTGNLTATLTAFELQWSDPQETTGYTSTADLQYIGINSNLQSTATVTNPTGVVSETTVYFGVSTYADWSLPSRFFGTWFNILIDTNRSGIAEDGTGAEFLLVNTDLGTATGRDGTDVFITLLVNLETNKASLSGLVNVAPATIDTAPHNNSVLVLPVNAGALGLNNMNNAFNYRVISYRSEVTDGNSYLPVDISDVATYNVAQPGIIFKDSLAGPVYNDLPDTAIGFDFVRSAFVRNRSEGILLLHHHNGTGNRAEVMTIQGGSVNYLPVIKQNAN